ncbi:hypothetical protein [Actinocatenispora sera]|nr:hypothetical protein [Actinocatenispora sera]
MMLSKAHETQRLHRIRHQVVPAVDDVLRGYGMKLPRRIDLEERSRGVRVCIVCTGRVPQYVVDRLRFAVFGALAQAQVPPADLVTVVVEDHARRLGQPRR